MNPVFINADLVRQLLPMDKCIDLMVSAMVAASNGTVNVPPRQSYSLESQADSLLFMPSMCPDLGVFGAKLLTLFPKNPSAGLPAVQGIVSLFDEKNGVPLAIIDAAEVTAIRTAAVSGLATRLLSRENSKTCGIFGTGVQAASHIDAVCSVRPIRDIYIWSRDFTKANEFASQQSDRVGINVQAKKNPREVSACDVICTVTGARKPILHGDWVSQGTHVNLVGAHSLSAREADTNLIVKSELYVDLTETAIRESGDIMIPVREGAIKKKHIMGEIGSLLAGRRSGRIDNDQITVFKSLGNSAQDLIVAHYLYASFRKREIFIEHQDGLARSQNT